MWICPEKDRRGQKLSLAGEYAAKNVAVSQNFLHHVDGGDKSCKCSYAKDFACLPMQGIR